MLTVLLARAGLRSRRNVEVAAVTAATSRLSSVSYLGHKCTHKYACHVTASRSLLSSGSRHATLRSALVASSTIPRRLISSSPISIAKSTGARDGDGNAVTAESVAPSSAHVHSSDASDASDSPNSPNTSASFSASSLSSPSGKYLQAALSYVAQSQDLAPKPREIGHQPFTVSLQ